MPSFKIVGLCTLAAILFAGCGGGGGGSSGGGGGGGGETPQSYSIAGRIDGLATNSRVELQLNGGAPLSLAADGAFVFPTTVPRNGSYAVTIASQPVGQTCTVNGGSGAGITANVSSVQVVCSTLSYSVSGTVVGLPSTEIVRVQLNAQETLDTRAGSVFQFATPVAFNGSYSVQVVGQPAGYACSVVNGTGSGVTASVTNVQVQCSTLQYRLSGQVTGLRSGQQVTVLNNGGDPITITSNSTFTFPAPIAFNGAYAVTVGTQPVGQRCSVTGGAGAGVTGDVSTVVVGCSDLTYAVSGTVRGLRAGRQVTLYLNNSSALNVQADGTFRFSAEVVHGGSFQVTVGTQPLGQTCSISNASGAGVISAVDTVDVTCSDQSYSVSGTLSGLRTGQQVTLFLNGGSPLTLVADGSFRFTTQLVYGASYAVTVSTQPIGQTCSATVPGDGTVTGEITRVAVVCATTTYPLSGTVSGLRTGQQVTITNGGEALTLGSNGTFQFGSGVPYGGGYAVAVSTQPANQLCIISNATGSNVTGPVQDVQVTCAGSGIVMLTLSPYGGSGLTAAYQSDGKLLVLGGVNDRTRNTEVALMRFMPSGALDPSFGINGVASFNTAGRIAASNWPKSAMLLPDGSIMVMGYQSVSGVGAYGIFIAKLRSDGSLDESFGTSGVVTHYDQFKDYFPQTAVRLQDGRLLVAGRASCIARGDLNGNCVMLRRLLPDGSIDSSFADVGTTSRDDSLQGATGMALQADGRILLTGTRDAGNGDAMAVVRYNADGVKDTSFGVGGIATIEIGSAVGDRNYGQSVAVQADGKIVLSGSTYSLTQNWRKLPRQVDSPEVETSWLNTLGLNTAGGTLPRESCGRYSL